MSESTTAESLSPSDIERYLKDPAAYISEKLDWEPWVGTDDHPGQTQIIDAYSLALRKQIERHAFEDGTLSEGALTVWTPGSVIQNRIRVPAGFTVGKTRLASGLVNHFFDCFAPSIVYTFAPSWFQIHDLLWKEIKTDRTGKGLPGRILDLELDRGHDHFAKGRATSNSGALGRERIQGQHGPYLMFVLDEAEAIDDYVWDAVDTMTSGGIVTIVLMLANPRTRVSRFHKEASRVDTVTVRISELDHPNVVQGRSVIDGPVRRDFVDKMLTDHCATVAEHDPDYHTFEVPWRPGIFRPDSQCLLEVLGIAPVDVADNTVIPVGRFEGATKREPDNYDPTSARMGVDVALFGRDMGTLYLRHAGAVKRLEQFDGLDYMHQAMAIKRHALELKRAGVRSLHIRIDAGGGFGQGVAEALYYDAEMEALFPDLRYILVHFGSAPYDGTSYADLVTEMYFEAAESLRGLAVLDPPTALEADLCERTWEPRNSRAVRVRKLEDKTGFRKRIGRSPDDGDGFVLAVAPDHLFRDHDPDVEELYDEPVEISRY